MDKATAITQTIRPVGEAIPPHAAVSVVQAAAAAVDGKLEKLSPDLASAIEESGDVRIERDRDCHRFFLQGSTRRKNRGLSPFPAPPPTLPSNVRVKIVAPALV